MYLSHWGLRESPFQNRLDSRSFYESPSHGEGMARLHFLVEQRRRLGLLMGGAGTGKSLLLKVFAETMRQQGLPAANFSLLGVEPVEFLRELATQLGSDPNRSLGVSELWRIVVDRIREYRYQQWATVILLDDADLAGQPVLLQLTRLAQHDLSPDSRLTLVLAGRQERIGRLGETLLELTDLRIDLTEWEASDTESYVTHCLALAGRQQPLFDRPAILRLHELTQGIPRRINQLADLALAAGAGQELHEIDADTVESVYHELGVIEV